MIGESGTGRNGVHHYYKCSSIKRKLKDCSKKTMKKERLEDTVIQAIKEFLDEPGTVDAVIELVMDLQGRDSLSLPAFEKQLGETNAAIDNLLNAIQQPWHENGQNVPCDSKFFEKFFPHRFSRCKQSFYG